MPFSPPAEAPHYNGKTLSPASPKPIHIPEPHNIPVLQNQTDPIFNLVSTHMDGPTYPSTATLTSRDPQGLAQQPPGGEHVEGAVENVITMNGQHDGHGHNSGQGEDLSHGQEDQNTSPNHASTAQPSSSTGASSSISALAQSNLASFTQNYSRDHDAEGPPAISTHQSFSTAPVNLPTTTYPIAQENSEVSQKPPDEDLNVDNGNIQALLDNLIASASAAPSTEPNASPTANAPSTVPQVASPSNAQIPIAALPTPAGLPPRPPPQEEPAIHPNYTPGQSIRSYHNPPNQAAPGTTSTTQPNSSYRASQNYPSSNAVGSNGMGPPPAATFQQGLPAQQQQEQQRDEFGRNATRSEIQAQGATAQIQLGPDRDQAYQDFLRDEAIYVSEGTWDRFPQGSRLFIGNLFTEKVSKRHLFDLFSKYGRLAQISMKNAYGFVQFVDPGCSNRAMLAEEGVELGSRKIHLEISKPQKNTRNAAATTAGDRMRASHGRRSRSPDFGRGGPLRGSASRPGPGAFDRSPLYNHFERRERDDYRPMRSPSPRGARGYDNYSQRNGGLDRYLGGRRSRSRSPYGRVARYRSRSPRGREVEDEGSLPIPRRNPVQVPDVQIILVEESDRTFVGYIQQSFRDRGLRCDVLQLPRGVALQAVVRRQIVEGVQAVVRILRKSQVTGKIPLQLFDRSRGLENIRYDDYEELDAGIAADIVIRSKNQQVAPSMPNQFSPNAGYGQTPQHMPGHPMPSQPTPAQQSYPANAGPSLTSAITSLDGPTLQKLLSSMNHNAPNPQQSQASQQQGQPPQDLATLLSSVARQIPQQHQSPQGYQPPAAAPPASQGYPYQAVPHQQQYSQPNAPAPNQSYANNPALSQLLNRPPQQSLPPQNGGPQYQMPPQHQQPSQQQNVQDIMAQLAKYRQ